MRIKPTFNNREISWLYFNERLLQEAEDPTVPLIERLKFLGIFSNNLDEFYRVRVATVKRMAQLKSRAEQELNFNPKKLMKKINEIDAVHQQRFEKIFNTIVNDLEKIHIHIINEQKLSAEQGEFTRKYFYESVRPNLFPVMIEDSDFTFPLKDNAIYLGIIMLKTGKPLRDKLALIKIPTEKLSRFLVLPAIGNKKFIILLDDVIRYSLREVFNVFDFDEVKAFTFKFTRDAELDYDNDISKSFLETVSESLKKRTTGDPVRFVYDKDMPEFLLKTLMRKLNISRNDTLLAAGRYHNFKDFMRFPNVGHPELEYLPLKPLPHKALIGTRSIFDVISQKDIMLHFPYQSFQYIIDLLREASIDPKVRSIRMTLYRLAQDSNIINALISAVRNGKSVTVFMEFQARFDEEANIQYAEILQEEGVRIIQAIPGFKVHGKLLLIRRKEGMSNVYYANLATGNYNENTATVYADDSLLTADPRITAEVLKVFELFEANYRQQKFKTLVVSPFKMRDHFIGLLKNEIKNLLAGKEAWAIIKVNSLVDEKIARQIYLAAKVGVKITVIVRGACILLPEANGLQENLLVFGMIDRFLEHSRVFVFCNGGDNLYYISSADWMSRNFDNRIEVALPVYDVDIQHNIMRMLKIQMNDNTKSRLIGLKKINKYRKTGSVKKYRSQIETYRFFQRELKPGKKK